MGRRTDPGSAVQFLRETRLFRVYSSSLVPGLLQSKQAARARVTRSGIVHEQGHRFVLVVAESALYYRVANEGSMSAQLGYLLAAGALPQVSLGVIPSAVRVRTQWPRETFHVYELRGMAVYGAEARGLILRAIEALR
ncbi:Scr1 family TA system antitoxin-like transcriptional regulator [Streptomyces coelicoflavus]|uniref:Scr1 family TA system antitoxin-like transcriptional regulator n=1 Tax=Streptomyces coelicoflavus TaxID=285562 RepID=UPI003693474C